MAPDRGVGAVRFITLDLGGFATRGFVAYLGAAGKTHVMPDPNPATVIVSELLQRLAQRPFEPFVIVPSNGSRHTVPTPDHCTVQRFSRRVNVDHDDGSFVTINPLHISQVELLHKPAA